MHLFWGPVGLEKAEQVVLFAFISSLFWNRKGGLWIFIVTIGKENSSFVWCFLFCVCKQPVSASLQSICEVVG